MSHRLFRSDSSSDSSSDIVDLVHNAMLTFVETTPPALSTMDNEREDEPTHGIEVPGWEDDLLGLSSSVGRRTLKKVADSVRHALSYGHAHEAEYDMPAWIKVKRHTRSNESARFGKKRERKTEALKRAAEAAVSQTRVEAAAKAQRHADRAATPGKRPTSFAGLIPGPVALNGLFQDHKSDSTSAGPSSAPAAPQPTAMVTSHHAAADVDSVSGDTPAQPNPKKLPCIFVKQSTAWPQIATALTALVNGDFEAVSRGDNFRCRTSTVDHFRAIQRFLCSEGIEFHTFGLRSRNSLKVVLKGVPKYCSGEELHDALTADRFAIQDVSRMKTLRGSPSNLWLVTLLPDGEREDPESKKAADIYRLTHLLHVRIEVQMYKRPAGPPQCHRCQGFGHGSSNCGRKLRCVRCGDAHTGNQCSKASGEPGKCCNCGGQHNANYRGCPAFQQLKASKKPVKDQRPAATAAAAAPPPPPDKEVAADSPAPDEDADSSRPKRRKRQARNPANRGPRPEADHSLAESTDPDLPPPKQRAAPRRKIDWPPKAQPPAAPPGDGDPPPPTKDVGLTAFLRDLMGQLTAVIGIIGEYLAKLSAAESTD